MKIGERWQVYDGAPTRSTQRTIVGVSEDNVQFMLDDQTIRTTSLVAFRTWIRRFRCQVLEDANVG